jgi:hypothetical protein
MRLLEGFCMNTFITNQIAQEKASQIRTTILEELRVNNNDVQISVVPDTLYPLAKFTTSKNGKVWKVGFIFDLDLYTVRVYNTAGSLDADSPDAYEVGANLADTLIKALNASK